MCILNGHARQVLDCDWHCGGARRATASADHTVKIWNLRMLGKNKQRNAHGRAWKDESEYTIPAHTSIVKGVRFGPRTGSFLVSVGYDHAVRFWSTRDFSPIGPVHRPHEEKVMCVDVSADERHVVTGGYDRTFKVWAEGDGLLAMLR